MIKTNKFKISKKLNFLKFSNFKKFKSEVQTFRKSAIILHENFVILF